MIETKNALIESTTLGTEDHGILTCFLSLNYGGSGQGFGGWGFDGPINDESGKFKGRQGSAWGMEFIRRLLETLEVEKWESLKGKYCRVRADYGKVYSIGHITKDKWFDPETDLAHLKNSHD